MKTYTFHISVPGTGRVWRKIEIPAEATLEDLHWAIQDAYDFDGDHLFSFFMSGRAWDRESEYCLPEDATPWDLLEIDGDWDDDDEDELDEEFDEQTTQDLRASFGDAPPQSFDEMLTLIEGNREVRDQLAHLMAKETGIPRFIIDIVLSNATGLLGDSLKPMREAGDVRTTLLDSLGLEAGKTFMYLFDYGDEWRFKVRVHAIAEDADPEAEYPRVVEEVGEAPAQYYDWYDEEAWDEEDEGAEAE